MFTELRPLAVLAVNFLVGVAVAHGYIDQSNSDVVINQISTFIGDAIIAFTALVAVLKYVHKAEIKGTVSEVASPSVVPNSATAVVQPVAPTDPAIVAV